MCASRKIRTIPVNKLTLVIYEAWNEISSSISLVKFMYAYILILWVVKSSRYDCMRECVYVVCFFRTVEISMSLIASTGSTANEEEVEVRLIMCTELTS